MLAEAGHDVTALIQPFSRAQRDLHFNLKYGVQKCNYLYLKDAELPENIRFTDVFRPAEKTDAMILAVPTKFLEKAYFEIEPYITRHPKCTLILLSKGFVGDSGMSWGLKIKNSLVFCGRRNFAVLSGYTPAKELALANLTKKYFAASAASRDINAIKKVRALFRGTHLGIVGTTDIRGVSIGGALKNAYAVGYGILLGLNENGLAWKYLELAHNEMKVFLDEIGASPKTWSSPAVKGDFYGTCHGELGWESRNVAFGKFLAKYPSVFEAMKYVSENTVEGYEALKTLHQIAHKNKLRAPILYAIHRICFYSASPSLILDLFIQPS